MGSKSADFTCITSRGSSVVDYLLCKPEWFELINNVCILPYTMYSDHCIVEFSLTCVHNNKTPVFKTAYKKYTWENIKKDQFINDLNTEEAFAKFEDVFCMSDASTHDDIDKMVNKFTNIICEAAAPYFCKTIVIKPHNKGKKCKWLTDECYTLRERFFECLNEYRKEHNEITRTNMTTARSNYVNCARKWKATFSLKKMYL
jgi:hypothetical protein